MSRLEYLLTMTMTVREFWMLNCEFWIASGMLLFIGQLMERMTLFLSLTESLGRTQTARKAQIFASR